MRLFALLVLTACVSMPLASAATPTVYVDADQAIVLAWTPEAGATAYYVFRQIGDETPVLLGRTTTPSFVDDEPPVDTSPVYTIRSEGGIDDDIIIGTSGGTCVSRDGLSISVTLHYCVRPQ